MASEVRSGHTISLDLPLDYFTPDISAFGGRPPPTHKAKQVASFCWEDSIDMNTQCSSQWDGFRHFAIRSSSKYYGGHESSDFESDNALSIHAWLQAGAITGRGVLVDFMSWAQRQGEVVDINGSRAITTSEIQAILEYQKTEVKPGDILIFRTGWLEWYNREDPSLRHEELCIRHEPGEHSFIGVAQETEFLEWLWNNQIAAVAGDQVAFEKTPPVENGIGWLHEHLLAALGCPVGELWNTEELAEHCRRTGRYSFFLSSTPLALRGGVASPANALAMF